VSSSSPAYEAVQPQPFAVDVHRVDAAAIVEPRGELDLDTAETLRAALDDLEVDGRVVLDLRGLSFIDSTGLRLLVTLHERSQRDGFGLTLVAPAPPADRAIQLSGLDQVLPFVPADAVDREVGEAASPWSLAPHRSGRRSRRCSRG